MLNIHFVTAQDWISLKKDTINEYGLVQFKINPYNNQMWLINDLAVSSINNEGVVRKYDENMLGDLWFGADISLTFSKNSTFFSKNLYGLYLLELNQSTLLYSNQNIRRISSNLDTVYIVNPTGGFKNTIMVSLIQHL
jgi:hypothetical protein